MDDDTSRYRLPEYLAHHLRGGENVLVYATPDTGPHAGERLVVVAARDELERAHRSILGMGRHRPRHLEVVRRSVRGALARSAPPPHTDSGLMTDLLILFAHKLLAGGSDRVLEGSGVAILTLMIEPDDDRGLTWRERGMLDPELERACKVPTAPGVLAA